MEKIGKQLDIANIIKRLFEVEKLKHFLLNENQLKLFDYIPKPVIADPIKKNQVQPL